MDRLFCLHYSVLSFELETTQTHAQTRAHTFQYFKN